MVEGQNFVFVVVVVVIIGGTNLLLQNKVMETLNLAVLQVS